MPIEVDLPDGTVAEFPDGTPDDVILTALRKNFPAGAGQTDIHGKPISGTDVFGDHSEAAGRFVRGVGQALNPIEMVKGLGQAIAHPIDTGKALYNKQVDTFARGAGDISEGRYSEGAGRVLAGLIPIVGPAAADVGERIGQGDVAGGLGEAIGLVGSVLGPGMVNKAAAPVRQGTQRVLRRGAERAMESAVKPLRSYVEKMSGVTREGVPALKRRVIGDILDEDVLPNDEGIGRMQSRVDALDAERTGKIAAAPQVPMKGAGHGVENAVLRVERELAHGTAPQKRVGAVRKLRKEMKNDPAKSEAFATRVNFRDRSALGMKPAVEAGEQVRRVKDPTPLEAAAQGTADNKILRDLYGVRSKTAGAEARGRMAAKQRLTRSLDKTAGTKKISEKMKRAIDVRNILQLANSRISSTNPITITDVISMATANPVAMGASLSAKGPVLARIARTANRAGKKIGAKHDPSKLLRALLQGQNLPEDEE